MQAVKTNTIISNIPTSGMFFGSVLDADWLFSRSEVSYWTVRGLLLTKFVVRSEVLGDTSALVSHDLSGLIT